MVNRLWGEIGKSVLVKIELLGIDSRGLIREIFRVWKFFRVGIEIS